MPTLTDTTIATRQAQALDVFALMRSGITQKDACEQVGISDDTYRRWINSDPNLTKVIGELIINAEKQELMLIQAVRTKILEDLLMAVVSEVPMDTKDKLAILKYLHIHNDQLATRHGASSDNEAAAAEYLQGPQLVAAESRMGDTQVEVTHEGNKTTVSITQDQPDIIDVQ